MSRDFFSSAKPTDKRIERKAHPALEKGDFFSFSILMVERVKKTVLDNFAKI